MRPLIRPAALLLAAAVLAGCTGPATTPEPASTTTPDGDAATPGPTGPAADPSADTADGSVDGELFPQVPDPAGPMADAVAAMRTGDFTFTVTDERTNAQGEPLEMPPLIATVTDGVETWDGWTRTADGRVVADDGTAHDGLTPTFFHIGLAPFGPAHPTGVLDQLATVDGWEPLPSGSVTTTVSFDDLWPFTAAAMAARQADLGASDDDLAEAAPLAREANETVFDRMAAGGVLTVAAATDDAGRLAAVTIAGQGVTTVRISYP